MTSRRDDRRDGDIGRRARRFVHLGERLLAIGRVRSGLASLERVADDYGVEVDDVRSWLEIHRGECLVTFEQLGAGATPETRLLVARAQRLAELVAQSERRIRDLHQEYLLALAAPAASDPEIFVDSPRDPD
ncbi:MAG TPA: hypothetical protein VEC19_17330 [Usitatibacter sp.]|nr:hypothetical protein [Usitatibacter sp.]